MDSSKRFDEGGLEVDSQGNWTTFGSLLQEVSHEHRND
jgi:hypothetical protein